MISLRGLVTLKPVNMLKEDEPIHGDANEPSNAGDHEGQMAKADLMAISKKAAELYNMVGENEGLEGWVQEKISLAADYINSVHSHLEYEKNKPQSLGSGDGAPADAAQMAENLDEKWAGDADIKSTGEHAGKTIEQLKSQLASLKAQSKAHHDKGEKVPEDIKKKEKQILFALRAKGGWKKGEGAVDEVAPEGWEGTVKAMKKHKDIDNPWALAHYMKGKGYKSHEKGE